MTRRANATPLRAVQLLTPAIVAETNFVDRLAAAIRDRDELTRLATARVDLIAAQLRDRGRSAQQISDSLKERGVTRSESAVRAMCDREDTRRRTVAAMAVIEDMT